MFFSSEGVIIMSQNSSSIVRGYGKSILMPKKEIKQDTGVTIITPSNSLNAMDKVFSNYSRQKWKVKELIVVLNNDNMNINEWKKRAREFKNISVYQLSEKKNIGSCLNFAIDKSKFDYIAKFDDDDYYGPNYLKGLMGLFNHTDADIVGKAAFYIYFENNQSLILKFSRLENKKVKHVAGATMLIKKSIFNHVRFSQHLLVGSDTEFLKNCVEKGHKIFSGNRYNYTCIRKENKSQHTWKIGDKELQKNSKYIGRMKDYKGYVTYNTLTRKS